MKDREQKKGIAVNTLYTMGGLLWMKYGHPAVFAGAAGIAIVMFIFSRQVRTPGTPPADVVGIKT